ncbi:MAG: ftsH 1 [Planctomycetota bacterium]|nr:ftsH 1 [Planctomycetota bacterium]
MRFSSSRPDKSRRLQPRWWFLLALAPVVIVLAYVAMRPTSVRVLSYGQFKKKLVARQIKSVRVGSSELLGELTEPSKDGLREFRVSRVGLERDDQLPALLDQYVPEGAYEADSGPGVIQNTLLPGAVLAVLLGGLYLVARRAGFGTAMAFAKSRHKMYGEGPDRVTFDDVAGIDEAVGELQEVVGFLKTPEKFRKLGGRIPKGILLVGPPGTGKTLLAKAVAGEAGVPFFSLSGSDFVEMFVGVGAARVRSLFAQAEEKAPCLIFIDELDALGKARSGGGSGGQDERDQTLNQLLVAMDGFDSNRGIIVMAATNRPETLDSALVRPGRFDRNVTVDRPDIGGREQILRVHVKNVPCSDAINLRNIAAMTSGFAGADLANLVNEAALMAARAGKESVDHLDFERGFERIVAGPEKRQRILRTDEVRRIAVHEAGHALIARSLPGLDPVHKVSIVGRGGGLGGFTLSLPEEDRFLHTGTWLKNTIGMLLGGTAAEELIYDGEISDGATSDLQRATQIARRMVTDFGMSPALGRVSYQGENRSPFIPGGSSVEASWSEQTAREIDLEVRRILDGCLDTTRSILSRRRAALEAITEALIARETLDAAELNDLLSDDWA